MRAWPVVFALLCACASPDDAAPAPVERFGFGSAPFRADVLLMVDGSSDMRVPQERLVAALPGFVERLVSAELELHVGVVTADMGAGGADIPTCGSVFGDDGQLRTRGDRRWPECMASYPPILAHDGRRDAHAAFATHLGCLARVGTDGCGFEQPLEAILKALSPAAPTFWTTDGYEAPQFALGTAGHGDGVNDLFRQPDALLVIVHLSTEDDCSVRDLSFFRDVPRSDLRCVERPEALHPISRYVDGFVALGRETARIVYVPIVGIPEDLEPSEEQLDAIAADERMQPRPDPASPLELLPSCLGDEIVGYPPARTVTLARQLRARGLSVVAGSICADSYAPVLATAAERVVRSASLPCMPSPVALAPGGGVDCTLSFHRSEERGCVDVPGEGSVPDELGGVRCELRQLVPTAADRAAGRPPEGRGWYVDDYSEEARQCDRDGHPSGALRFAGELPDGFPHLVCRLPVGRACDPSCALDGLTCDPVDQVCALPCVHDGDCWGYGGGFTCDRRSLEAIDPSRFDGSTALRGVCQRGPED